MPLYVSVLGTSQYGVYASLMAFLILGNVLLSYGMETAFFRFVNKHPGEERAVQKTALFSLLISSVLFLALTLPFSETIGAWLDFRPEYVLYGLIILALDALAVIPFAWFRIHERPMRYAIIKILNVVINLGFNLFFFLWLPHLAEANPDSFWSSIWLDEQKVAYVFIANIIASGLTLLMLLPIYLTIGIGFHAKLWKGMLRYAMPILIAGIAFSINEAFDKILLKYLLPPDIAESEVGVYAACYKLGVFMTLFATAFRLGIEPFFFNHAGSDNAKQTYATITKYFSIFGSLILLTVVVFIDVFKQILIPDSAYWEALSIVPIILLANLCLGIYHNLSVWYKITDRTHFGAIISVVGAMITLALNFLLIPLLSYLGSAIATLAAYGSMMLLSYFYGQRYYAVPYSVLRIGGYIGIAIVLSALSFYALDSNILIGIGFLVLFIGLIYKNEKQVLLRLMRR